MPSEKIKYIYRRMARNTAKRTDIVMPPLKEEIETIFSPANIDEDCRTIATLLYPYEKKVRQLLESGDISQAITITLEIYESLSYHFVADEHYCHFDDMYSPDYPCQYMMEAIISKIKDGAVSEEEQCKLAEGMERLKKMESYEQYGSPYVVMVWDEFRNEK